MNDLTENTEEHGRGTDSDLSVVHTLSAKPFYNLIGENLIMRLQQHITLHSFAVLYQYIGLLKKKNSTTKQIKICKMDLH